MKNIAITFLMIFLFSQISFPFGNQGDWRWRNDDGDVYSATWKDSLNSPLVISSKFEDNIRLRLKFLYQSLSSGNISLQYSERPGEEPWILINNVDTGKFFISHSTYLTDTMSYFDNQLLPPDKNFPYLRTITFDSSYNYNFTGIYNHAYELEYSLKTAPDLEPGTEYYFSLFSDTEPISLAYLKEYPILKIPPVNWNNKSSGTTETLYGVSFVDENTGWTVGYNGTVLHTTNGGDTWIPESSGTTYSLYDAAFTNNDNGWIVGEYGTILHTTDGGQNWILQQNVTTEYLSAVFFIDVYNGWIVGAQGILLHTIDGGITWSHQYLGNSCTIPDVAFIDANHGLVVSDCFTLEGDYGFCYRTSDGGVNWTASDALPRGLNAVSFADSKNGTVVGGDYAFNGTGESSGMYRTTDGGETWTDQTQTSHILQDVYYADANNGWAVGTGGTVLKTSDGGATWEFQASGTIKDLNAVSFADANNGFVVGQVGKILGTTNGGIPVELTSFSTQSNGNNVLLKWSTATEINNRGFEVQRSSDNSEYTRIGFVEGNGSATEQHTYSYTDKNLNKGKYYYRLKQIDLDGGYKYSDVAEVTVNAPIEFSLQQNYPNPFNPETTIKYSIPEKLHVILKVYDILGSEIGTLINEVKPAGIYELNWSAVNLPSGVYFYQLKAGSYIETRKMIMMK